MFLKHIFMSPEREPASVFEVLRGGPIFRPFSLLSSKILHVCQPIQKMVQNGSTTWFLLFVISNFLLTHIITGCCLWTTERSDQLRFYYWIRAKSKYYRNWISCPWFGLKKSDTMINNSKHSFQIRTGWDWMRSYWNY